VVHEERDYRLAAHLLTGVRINEEEARDMHARGKVALDGLARLGHHQPYINHEPVLQVVLAYGSRRAIVLAHSWRAGKTAVELPHVPVGEREV
jgi:hypothetical protein